MLRMEGNRALVIRAGARGLVAAMAMTGSRTVTAALAPEERTPPQAIVEEHAPLAVRRLTAYQRQAMTELFHWAYGVGGGLVFGLLPPRVRGLPGTGVVYGLVVWLAFETGIAPPLKIQQVKERPVLWRTAMALDHVLYGVVVAGRLAPEPAARVPRAPQCHH